MRKQGHPGMMSIPECESSRFFNKLARPPK